jgi:hypothetical protein
MKSKTFLWYQYSLCLVLSIFDFFLTKYYLSKVGHYGEGNPFQHWMLVHYGTYSMLEVKILSFLIVAVLLLLVREQAYGWIGTALKFVNIGIGVVIGWSVYCIGTVT